MFAPHYPVVTGRLLLRPYEPGDVDAVHAYQSLPERVRYVPYQARTRDQVLERVTSAQASTAINAEGDVLLLVMVLRETGEVIGDVVLFYRSEVHRTGEIGYILNPEHGGHGYATEAARTLLALGFEGLGLHRIIARVDARNAASLAVLRRIGMRQEAHLVQNEWFKGEWTDEIDYAILDEEWRAAQASA
jgi:RimJ/RimL family protein N-acetyltransferase